MVWLPSFSIGRCGLADIFPWEHIDEIFWNKDYGESTSRTKLMLKTYQPAIADLLAMVDAAKCKLLDTRPLLATG